MEFGLALISCDGIFQISQTGSCFRQSDGRVPQSEERNALGGFRRGGSVKESSSKKVLHATSAGDLNSDSGSKHNQQPLPTQSHPQGSAGGALLTKGHKKGSTASVQQVEENNSNKHARKSSGGRSKSQERPAANNHSHVSVKKRNGASGSGHASEEMEGVGKMDASKRTENGSVDINENLRKSKDGRSVRINTILSTSDCVSPKRQIIC